MGAPVSKGFPGISANIANIDIYLEVSMPVLPSGSYVSFTPM